MTASILLVLGSVFVFLASGFPALKFDQGYSHLFGETNLQVVENGKSVRISLDERTGSGFRSRDEYLHGYFSASIKLPRDYTAGVVVAFYMSNGEKHEKDHDEIDFEFLGNTRGKQWRIQTNVYGNGSTSFGREERYGLWFDPTEDSHRYAVLWTENLILFMIDGVAIREMWRTSAMRGDFPSKPMSLYATIWDGSGWATDGGKYPVDYGYAPFVSEFSDLVLRGESRELRWINGEERQKMRRFRRKYMQYSYCYDRKRYEAPLPECVVEGEEAEQLRRFDPVTFGRGHRRGKRQRRPSITGASSSI